MGKKQCGWGWAWLGALLFITARSSGRPPLGLGVTEGRLAPCPSSPNCVSSEATTTEQRIAPLRYQGDAEQAHTRLRAVLSGMARVRIVEFTDEDYLHVEFRSSLFGFVDDLEYYLSPPGTIQVRSASRTEYYDFGVNRERVETICSRFSAAPVTRELQYRFGPPDAPEIVWPKPPQPQHAGITAGILAFSGGGGAYLGYDDHCKDIVRSSPPSVARNP